METYCSVNDTLEKIEELDGVAVQVEGILTELFNGSADGYQLLHYPAAERHAATAGRVLHHVGLWLEFGNGSIQPNRAVLSRWLGKRVRVHAVAHCAKFDQAHDAFHSMADPSCWQPHLEVYSIQRVTSEQRKGCGI